MRDWLRQPSSRCGRSLVVCSLEFAARGGRRGSRRRLSSFTASSTARHFTSPFVGAQGRVSHVFQSIFFQSPEYELVSTYGTVLFGLCVTRNFFLGEMPRRLRPCADGARAAGLPGLRAGSFGRRLFPSSESCSPSGTVAPDACGPPVPRPSGAAARGQAGSAPVTAAAPDPGITPCSNSPRSRFGREMGPGKLRARELARESRHGSPIRPLAA